MWRGARARGAVGGTVSPSYCSPSFTEVGRHKSWQLRATPAYMPPPPAPRGRHGDPPVLPCTMALPPSQASSRAGRILFMQVPVASIDPSLLLLPV